MTGFVVDGSQLTEIGSVSINLESEALIGLAVTSHQTGVLATGVFDAVSR